MIGYGGNTFLTGVSSYFCLGVIVDIFEEPVVKTSSSTSESEKDSGDALVRAFGRLGERIEQSLVTFSSQIRAQIDAGNANDQSFFLAKANNILADNRRATRRNAWIMGAMMTAVVLIIAMMSHKQERILTQTLSGGFSNSNTDTVTPLLVDSGKKLDEILKISEQTNKTVLLSASNNDKKLGEIAGAIKAIPVASAVTKPSKKAKRNRRNHGRKGHGRWVYLQY